MGKKEKKRKKRNKFLVSLGMVPRWAHKSVHETKYYENKGKKEEHSDSLSPSLLVASRKCWKESNQTSISCVVESLEPENFVHIHLSFIFAHTPLCFGKRPLTVCTTSLISQSSQPCPALLPPPQQYFLRCKVQAGHPQA